GLVGLVGLAGLEGWRGGGRLWGGGVAGQALDSYEPLHAAGHGPVFELYQRDAGNGCAASGGVTGVQERREFTHGCGFQVSMPTGIRSQERRYGTADTRHGRSHSGARKGAGRYVSLGARRG